MSFASSLSAVGPVSSLAVRARGRAAVDRLLGLPGVSNSRAVSVVSVVRGVDRVSVVCSDGRVRVCRVSYASRVLGCALSVDSVFAKMVGRVGQTVLFFAAEGWSSDSWFVGCVGQELVGQE
jgi:hypothetical protein